MFKNRFLIVLSVLSLLLVTMAVSRPSASVSVSGMEGANDFYQRHPDGINNVPSLAVPVTGGSEWVDYFQRHPLTNTSSAAGIAVDMADYFIRHPELRTPSTTNDLSDYFQRH